LVAKCTQIYENGVLLNLCAPPEKAVPRLLTVTSPPDSPEALFRQRLEAALDKYHPGWDIRRHATWHPEYDEIWQQNRRFMVWVDTLKRWVRGENFPRAKKFQDFLSRTAFPPDLQTELLGLYHAARHAQRQDVKGVPPDMDEEAIPLATTVKIVGHRPVVRAQFFVGRSVLLQMVLNALGSPNGRLVSLVGRSGIGKTALACRVFDLLEAHATANNIWEGVLTASAETVMPPDTPITTLPGLTDDLPEADALIYLSAASTTLNADTLISALLQILDAPTDPHSSKPSLAQATRERFTALFAGLEAKTVYILLDNIDTLLNPRGQLQDELLAEFIVQAISHTPNLYFLLTSQIEPRWPGSIRHLHQLIALDEGLSLADGVRLLRNLDPNGQCGLRDAPEALLQQAVERVYGVPRALEVIVGILEDDPLLRLDDILGEFGQFDDIREMMMQVFHRLDDDSRWVLRVLAVCRQPMPAEAITYILSPFRPDLPLKRVLAQLSHTHLLDIDRANGLLQVHPIDADLIYNELQTQAAAVLADLEKQTATWFAQFIPLHQQTLEDFLPRLNAFTHYIRAGAYAEAHTLFSPADYQALLTLGHPHRVIELRQALQDHLPSPTDEIANALALGQLWASLGRYPQAETVYNIVLHHRQARLTDRLMALSGLGTLAYQKQDAQTAMQYYLEALALPIITTTLDATGLQADNQARLGLSNLFHEAGQHEQALYYTESALKIAEDTDNMALMGNCLALLSLIYRNMTYHPQALTHGEEALLLTQNLGDWHTIAERTSLLGVIHADMGEFVEAWRLQRQALTLAIQGSDLHLQTLCHARLARVCLAQGDWETARQHCAEISSLGGQIGVPAWQDIGALGQMRVSLISGQGESTPVPPSSGIYHVASWQWALWYIYQEMWSAAAESLTPLLTNCLPIDAPRIYLYQGIILARQDQGVSAQAYFQQVLATAQESLNTSPAFYLARYALALAWAGLALLADVGDSQMNAWQHAQDACQGAYQACAAPGVVKEALLLLNFLQPLDTADGLDPLRRILSD
jgi:tetratricopeptide (TPR) repeat protein